MFYLPSDSCYFYWSVFGFLSLLMLSAGQLRARHPQAAAGLAVLVLAALCAFATVRDAIVGSDFLGVYGRKGFLIALQYDDFGSYWSCDLTNTEYTYKLLLYLMTRVSDNERIYFLTFALLTMGSFLWGFWRLDGGVWAPAYCLLIMTAFVGSFSMIRQSAAMGLMVLALSFWRGRGGGWRFWLIAVALVGAHGSAFAALAALLLIGLWAGKEAASQVRILLLVAAGCAVLYFVLGDLIALFELTKFENYATMQEDVTQMSAAFRPTLNKKGLLMGLFYLLVVLCGWRQGLLDNKERFAAAVMALLTIYGTLLFTISTPAGRFSFYFSNPTLFYVLLTLRRAELRLPVWTCRATFALLCLYLVWSSGYGCYDYSSELLGLDFQPLLYHMFSLR